jgi:hypothetical protein
LDWRIFIGKVEDFISYRIGSCSCFWIGGLDHRKIEGKFSILLISKERRRKRNIQLDLIFFIPSRRTEASVPVAANAKGLGCLQVEHVKINAV